MTTLARIWLAAALGFALARHFDLALACALGAFGWWGLSATFDEERA